MALYVFYTFGIAALMLLSRVRSIQNGQVKIKYFRVYQGSELPDRIAVIGRHYDNQFQVPVLFLATCACFIALNKADVLSLILAWTFVITRIIHSFIHLGKNNVAQRAAAFAAGWVVIMLMWAQLMYFAADK